MGLHTKETEHGHTVHFKADKYRPLREDGTEAGGIGCLEMVRIEGDSPIRCKSAGGNGSGSGSGWGRVEGSRRDGVVGDYGQELMSGDIPYRFKHIIGTESSIPVASVLGLELHHPNMSMLWGHIYRSKTNK